jgi:hypothetical protein
MSAKKSPQAHRMAMWIYNRIKKDPQAAQRNLRVREGLGFVSLNALSYKERNSFDVA